jgi:2',3'-cyclic-nucleotide 2'-phosphodiesterase (5'-nucleotidase family)
MEDQTENHGAARPVTEAAIIALCVIASTRLRRYDPAECSQLVGNRIMTPRHTARLTLPIAASAALAALALAWIGPAHAEPATITFLHTNDVYEIAPKDGQGGFAELATLLEQERASHAHTITTFGGDLISPSVLSGLTKGTQMIKLMGLLDTDIAVLGNHEFDFGPGITTERIEASTFPWLGTNVRGADGKPATGTVDLHLMDVAGYKVGFFGLLAPETEVLSSPGADITFAPLVETAQAAVAQLREQGADLIVALTHLDLADDLEVARNVEGINLIFGGHDHNAITYEEGDTLIVKAGHDAHYLAAVDLTVDRVMKRDKEVVEARPEWRYLSTAGVAPDPEVQAIVDQFEKVLDEELNVPVGTTTVALDSRRDTVRTTESNFGNLIADALRETVGADVAIANGGGIRGDRTYDAGSVLTRKDILTELPFGNVTVVVEISGADLRAALENGVSEVEDKAGRFAQVSGMTYRYDAASPAGSRIVEVLVAGEPLDPARTYTLATNDYIFGGGDGYEALTHGKALVDASAATLMASMVMDYIAAKGEVAPAVEDRIGRIN